MSILGQKEIPAFIMTVSNVEARLIEIAENLHRNELTKLERSEQIEEWMTLTGKLSQDATVNLGGRGKNEEGARAAARELGIQKDEAHRALKMSVISDDAKQAARDVGLDDNQAALLEAAQQPKERQAATIHAISDAGSVSAYKAAQKAVKLAPEPMGDFAAKEKWLSSIMALWNRAAPEWREEFMSRIDGPLCFCHAAPPNVPLLDCTSVRIQLQKVSARRVLA